MQAREAERDVRSRRRSRGIRRILEAVEADAFEVRIERLGLHATQRAPLRHWRLHTSRCADARAADAAAAMHRTHVVWHEWRHRAAQVLALSQITLASRAAAAAHVFLLAWHRWRQTTLMGLQRDHAENMAAVRYLEFVRTLFRECMQQTLQMWRAHAAEYTNYELMARVAADRLSKRRACEGLLGMRAHVRARRLRRAERIELKLLVRRHRLMTRWREWAGVAAVLATNERAHRLRLMRDAASDALRMRAATRRWRLAVASLVGGRFHRGLASYHVRLRLLWPPLWRWRAWSDARATSVHLCALAQLGERADRKRALAAWAAAVRREHGLRMVFAAARAHWLLVHSIRGLRRWQTVINCRVQRRLWLDCSTAAAALIVCRRRLRRAWACWADARDALHVSSSAVATGDTYLGGAAFAWWRHRARMQLRALGAQAVAEEHWERKMRLDRLRGRGHDAGFLRWRRSLRAERVFLLTLGGTAAAAAIGHTARQRPLWKYWAAVAATRRGGRVLLAEAARFVPRWALRHMWRSWPRHRVRAGGLGGPWAWAGCAAAHARTTGLQAAWSRWKLATLHVPYALSMQVARAHERVSRLRHGLLSWCSFGATRSLAATQRTVHERERLGAWWPLFLLGLSERRTDIGLRAGADAFARRSARARGFDKWLARCVGYGGDDGRRRRAHAAVAVDALADEDLGRESASGSVASMSGWGLEFERAFSGTVAAAAATTTTIAGRRAWWRSEEAELPNMGEGDEWPANDAFGAHNDAFGAHNDAVGAHNDAFGAHNDAFGAHNDAFGAHNDAFGAHNDAFGAPNDALGAHGSGTLALVSATEPRPYQATRPAELLQRGAATPAALLEAMWDDAQVAVLEQQGTVLELSAARTLDAVARLRLSEASFPTATADGAWDTPLGAHNDAFGAHNDAFGADLFGAASLPTNPFRASSSCGSAFTGSDAFPFTSATPGTFARATPLAALATRPTPLDPRRLSTAAAAWVAAQHGADAAGGAPAIEGASRKAPMSDATLRHEFDRLLAAIEADEVLGTTPRTGCGTSPMAKASLAFDVRSVASSAAVTTTAPPTTTAPLTQPERRRMALLRTPSAPRLSRPLLRWRRRAAASRHVASLLALAAPVAARSVQLRAAAALWRAAAAGRAADELMRTALAAHTGRTCRTALRKLLVVARAPWWRIWREQSAAHALAGRYRRAHAAWRVWVELIAPLALAARVERHGHRRRRVRAAMVAWHARWEAVRSMAHGYLGLLSRVGRRVVHDAYARWWLVGRLRQRSAAVRAVSRRARRVEAMRAWRALAAHGQAATSLERCALDFWEPRQLGLRMMALEAWRCAGVRTHAAELARELADASAARSRVADGVARWRRYADRRHEGAAARSLDIIMTLVRHSTERQLASRMVACFAHWRDACLLHVHPVVKRLMAARKRLEACGMRPLGADRPGRAL